MQSELDRYFQGVHYTLHLTIQGFKTTIIKIFLAYLILLSLYCWGCELESKKNQSFKSNLLFLSLSNSSSNSFNLASDFVTSEAMWETLRVVKLAKNKI